jgi:hypothetical protein
LKGEDKRIVNVASFAASRAPTIDFNQVNFPNVFSAEIPKFLAHYTAIWRKNDPIRLVLLRGNFFI